MKHRKLQRRFASTGLALVLVLSLSVIASAGVPSPGVALGPFSPAGTDDGSLDCGAEYPSADAPGTVDDRPIHKDSAWNFYNKMRGAGYTGGDSFIWGNTAAWETDWKRAALGGSENYWVDDVDIMFVHSHGNYSGGVGSIWIPYGHTDTNVVPNDCAGSWGTNDLEWLGIKTCLTLADAGGWAGCMNGVHIIAGFTTLSASNEFGGYWADQLLGWKFLGMWLRSPKTVTQAWFTTCDARTAGARARVLAEDTAHFNDKVWERGGPALGDVVNSTKWYIDHNCYKPAPTAVDVSVLATVPAYRVLSRNVDQTFAESLAATLGVPGQLGLSMDGQEYAVTTADGRTLSIQTATGGYTYQDTNQLWVPPDPGAPLSLPGREEAARLAGAFFLANASALPGGQNFDAAAPYVETDTMTTLATGASAAGGAVPTAETGVDVMVAYGRTLATTATAAGGDKITANVSVAGPGSATKMYLGGQNTAPIGLSGGSRDVETGNEVTLKDVNATWEAFLEDPELAILEITVEHDAVVRHVELDTFAYFEQPLDVPQKELIPAWVYNVDFMMGEEVVAANGLIYVPASADYYPPDVTIDQPLPGATLIAGRPIALNATLAGGNGPFTYEWASSSQGPLGAAQDINVMLLGQSKDGDPPVPVTISLKVTDANGLSRIAQVEVSVAGAPVWLPLTTRE